MKMTTSMRPCGRVAVTLAFVLGLAACGGKEDAPAPAPTSAPAQTAAQPAPEPAAVLAEAGEAVLIQPSLVDTLSSDELLERAEEAVREKQLFVPAGGSAFEMYLRVVEFEPNHVRAKNALTDLFPYAVLYVEQRVAARDLPESERVLEMMERANENAPALPRLQRSVAQLRDMISDEAQREAQRVAAQQAAAQQAAQVAASRPATPVAAPVEPASAPVPQSPVATTTDVPTQTPPTATADTQAVAPPPVTAPAPVTRPATPPPSAAPAAPVMPTVLSSVQPRYPPVAFRRRVEGSVEVGFTIMPDGSVSNVRVLSSRPNSTFDREAINAMERWRFTPPGRQVESRRSFDFKLD